MTRDERLVLVDALNAGVQRLKVATPDPNTEYALRKACDDMTAAMERYRTLTLDGGR